jgi:hypothetical protein
VRGYPRRALGRAVCWPIAWVVFDRDTRHALSWLDGVQHSGNTLDALYGFLYNDVVMREFQLTLLSGPALFVGGLCSARQIPLTFLSGAAEG